MKINDKIISIPPYISTTWNNINTIYMKGSLLVISLLNGNNILIPDLKTEIIQLIFASHTSYLEKEEQKNQQHVHKTPSQQYFDQGNIFRLELGNIESLGTALNHNPANANAPDLPKEILTKISSIAKMMNPEEISVIPKAEPHCNCVYCQIARVMTDEKPIEEIDAIAKSEPEEEIVSDEELTFEEWSISQVGDHLFSVANKLDANEKYNVFLGNPVGCTCGQEGCEHILAVLKANCSKVKHGEGSKEGSANKLF